MKASVVPSLASRHLAQNVDRETLDTNYFVG